MSKVSRKQLAEAIVHILKKSTSKAELARNVAAYLITETRTRELDSLIRDIMQLRFEDEGVLELDIISAHPVTDEIKSIITSKLPAKQYVVNEEVLPELVGGVRIQTTDSQLDLTVVSRLNSLKNKLSPA